MPPSSKSCARDPISTGWFRSFGNKACWEKGRIRSQAFGYFGGKAAPSAMAAGSVDVSGGFELFEIDDHIRSMIMERQDTSAIRAEAITRGMKTMFQDGIAKAFFGETTLEEVFRVAV
jgi:type II secretory ATPase GspE/PulE/Tfp pilus assembly ATPase PilB-like protein